MSMRIDEAWYQHLASAVDTLGVPRFLNLSNILNDSIITNAYRGVSENLAVRVLGDNPVTVLQEESQWSGLLAKLCLRVNSF